MEVETTDDIKIDYKLFIKPDLYTKILWYVDNCENEISGLCDVEWNPGRGVFELNEVYLVKQEVSSTSTELDADALAELYFNLTKSGKTTMPRLWWHSHAKMGVFWSQTDLDTMQELKNDSYTIALEFNHAHQMLCRLLIWHPFPVVIDDVKVMIDLATDTDTLELEAEMKAKVSESSVVTHYKSNNSFKFDGLNPKTNKNPEWKYQELPKNKGKALTKIRNKHLKMIWDQDSAQWVYKDPYSNTVFVDTYEVIDYYDTYSGYD